MKKITTSLCRVFKQKNKNNLFDEEQDVSCYLIYFRNFILKMAACFFYGNKVVIYVLLGG